MMTKLLRLISVVPVVALLLVQLASAIPTDHDLTLPFSSEYLIPSPPVPQLSSDGKTLYDGVLPVVYVADPNPSPVPLRIQAPFDLLTLPPESATAAFSISYVPNGVSDPFGNICSTFPNDAKVAFEASADIWANMIQSSVPITISACWADLGSNILGMSGGGNLTSDFVHAPVANTFYTASLANALAGSDLFPSYFDMHITHNFNISWYTETDGATPGTQVDLMSVVLHEIAHGLGFAGSMGYSGGYGNWGFGISIPIIYDTFMRDGSGNQLINTSIYGNPSTALGTALTSNNIWFHGSNAMAANGDQRVKMYAPSSWAGGSSYSHLDYNTFNNTMNQLMVYAISAGESVHDPGPITLGILKDLGWTTSSSSCIYSVNPINSPAFSPSGGTGSFNITTQAGCPWTATEALDWVVITSGASGTGNGTINYSVSSNPGTDRSGTISISGQAFTATHTVTQAGCAYSVNPASSPLFSPSGGTGSFNITTQPGCSWTATEALSWVNITSAASGMGNGTVNYTVSSNAGTDRSGTISISGQASFTGTHTINQASPGGTNLLQNPGFENGNTIWVHESGSQTVISQSGSTPVPAHSGNWLAWFGGYPGANDVLYEEITIPSWTCQAYVQFWYFIATEETSGQNDILTVEIRRNSDHALLKTLKTLSNLDGTSGWVQSQQFDVTEFAGQSVRLRFAATTNATNNTNFFIDDVNLMVMSPQNIIYVKGDGACAGKIPCYSSIQGALNGANTCTIINTTGDVYPEDVVLNISKCLVLQGGWDSTLTTIQSNTTIRSLIIAIGRLTAGNIILE